MSCVAIVILDSLSYGDIEPEFKTASNLK